MRRAGREGKAKEAAAAAAGERTGPGERAAESGREAPVVLPPEVRPAGRAPSRLHVPGVGGP